MKEILAYKDFAGIDFNDSFENFLIIRGFNKNDSERTVWHDIVAVAADSWRDLSQKLVEKYEYTERTEFNSTVEFNYFSARLPAYNKILNILLDKFEPAYIGIAPAMNVDSKCKAIDVFVNDSVKMSLLHPAARLSVKNLHKARTGDEIFFFEFPEFLQVQAYNDIRDLVKAQLFQAGRYEADDVLVLQGDAQVKKFVTEKGKSLLAQIDFGPRRGRSPEASYLRGFWKELPEGLNEHYFPQARAAYNARAGREKD